MRIDNSYEYKYPGGVNLRPDSDLHEKLRQALSDRIRRGYAAAANHREMWKKLDHLQTAYVPADAYSTLDLERDPKAAMDVVVPVSRANLDTMVSYSAGVLFGDPTGMYQLEARSNPEAMLKAAKMDRLLNTQAQWFKHKLSNFVSLRDTFLYGLSCRMPVWAKHKRRQPVDAEINEVLYYVLKKSGLGLNIGDIARYLDEIVYHEGNEIENIDPYSLIIDPNAKLNQYQKAEFIGYFRRTHAMELLKDESDPEMRVFNAKYARDYAKSSHGRSQESWLNQSGRNDRMAVSGDSEVPTAQLNTTTEIDIARLFWTMIPSEWGLGDSDRPEMWMFALACDEVIVQAYKVDYDHGKNPMILDGPQTCGYDLFPVSSLSATYGIHQFIDWKVRMHYWNASRVNNSMFVLDGSVINADDFKRGGPRQIIRLKRPLYGDKTIDQFFRQLNVVDHTNDYPQHIQAMMQFNDYCLGTNAITQGDMSNMPERPTQWGLQASQQAALSRLAKDCQVITEQGYYDIVEQMAHNNVQFMEHERVLSIIGSRFEQQLRDEFGLVGNDISVSPWDLDMDAFEIMPVNRMQKETTLATMDKLMQTMLTIPEIAMTVFGGMDVQRMFFSLIRRMGFENIHEFKAAGGNIPAMAAQTMPDEQVLAQEQAGNIVPVDAVAA